MKKLSLIFLFFLTGCTSINVNKVSNEYNIDEICIEKNEKVIFPEFLASIKSRIEYHQIKTLVYSENEKPNSCLYTLWYTALRSWDITPYLSHAELRLYQNNRVIGEAEYHLKGGGGLSLTKWASTSTKMNPVIDELLNKK